MKLPKGAHYPVYPQPALERGKIDQRQRSDKGLTLLDHLAIEALPVAQARTSSQRAGYVNGPAIMEHASPEYVAKEAYDLAEAMLTERQNRHAAEVAPQA
ncbi:hypothetical protein [Hymenobacter sp. YC55]|uniref:hypothetical protein n=1 Tax=Hymenobacter sp. YC55 TaxID=3034019 RepID=UPI0023F6A989|nr:hypothetical protein [Hymenobacter sp. YC55]MDF7815351.1 hypothetical protein [Hymenobacter sp. YC55]